MGSNPAGRANLANGATDESQPTPSQIKSGKVKAFAVTSKKRVPSLPDIPTLDELGLKGVEVGIWHG